jgi:hypothetical protein
MSENLLQTLPEYRHSALREEMELLDSMVIKLYSSSWDQALARVDDPQGLGAASGRRSARQPYRRLRLPGGSACEPVSRSLTRRAPGGSACGPVSWSLNRPSAIGSAFGPLSWSLTRRFPGGSALGPVS